MKVKEIQRRGHWLAPKSVRRCEKTGKFTRQVSLMSRKTVRLGEQLLQGGLADLVKSTLPFIPKLRREELL